MNTDQNKVVWNQLALALLASLILSCGTSLWAANEDDDEPAKVKQTELMMMDADGKNLKVLFKSDKFTAIGSPVFSPDGKKVALDGKQNEEGFAATRILVIKADGSEMVDLGSGSMPSWSVDGQRMAFSNPGGGVWLMDADGENREQIDPMGWGAQWSPDGKLICYAEGANIKIFDAEEETFRYVFPFGKSPYASYRWNSCWSPDSKSICIHGRKPNGTCEIATIEIDKGVKGVKVHYSDPKKQPGDDFSWDPHSKKILCTLQFPEFKARKIFTLDPTKKDSQVVLPGQKDDRYPGSVCWSPDGKKIIYTLR